jgi:hypothetical protein
MALVDMAGCDSVPAPHETRTLAAWTRLLPGLRAFAFCPQAPVGLIGAP